MKTKLIILIILTQIIATVTAQRRVKTGKNYIQIVIPETDTVKTTLSRYRLAANTLPASKVLINGKRVKVYKNGVFVHLFKLKTGENKFSIISKNKKGRVSKELVFIREDTELKSTPEDTLRIEDEMMLPDKDIWLDEGDILQVRMKGTPNCVATFMNGILMNELPEEETGGIKGIYTGIYKIKSTDEIWQKPVTFKLENLSGEIVEKKSKARISITPKEFPRVGVTVGERPYLNYSLGTNRLGGAKLSFLEDGIKLIINGKVGNQYRVKLTENLTAWIPEEQVKLLPLGTFLPQTLTESWNVYGDKKYDYVVINLNEKIPYSTRQEVNPTKIIVDLYGAVANTNWITQHLNTSEIKNVYYEQVSTGLFRVTIETKHKHVWGYKIGYKNKSLVIRIKRTPKKLTISNFKFIVDAGHGGKNKGALGATGVKEKEVTLAIAKKIKLLLERNGAKVILTRSDDSYEKNSKRLDVALNSNADFLISIHTNSVGMSTNPVRASGTSTYYKHICYRPLSQAIYKRMLELGLKQFGNIGSFNFALNSPTEIPNVLVETAFISNPLDEMKLLNKTFQKKIAEKIVRGIKDYLKEVRNDNKN